MPLSDLPNAVLQTIVRQIALLLLRGAGGDMQAAQQAALATIRAHAPQTEAEFRLAARIISFSLQAGEALAQAAHPEMPILRVLRLRSGAVSLAREAQKAERQLAKLQQDRLTGVPPQPEPAPEPASPKIEKATALIEDNRKISSYAKANGLTWSQALQQRERDRRLAVRRAKEQARQQAAGPVLSPA